MRVKKEKSIRKYAFFLIFLTIFMATLININFQSIFAKAATSIGNLSQYDYNGNILLFNSNENQVMVELCTDRTVRIQLSNNGNNGYRPTNPEYYIVQKNNWPEVSRTIIDQGTYISITTDAMEIRIEKQPIRIGMYDLLGNLISKDTDNTGMYWNGNTVGVKKEENIVNSGGIFGFGSGDHGRRDELNRYDLDFDEFTMSHGRVVAPFFMSTVGYGIFLNTIEKDTIFYKKGGGFQTTGYLDYFFMYGPYFKTIMNEYAEITGRMEMYGKWAHGFMLSKYGNDNATQAEFSEWINRMRNEGYPIDSYVFDYGWRGDINDNGGNQSGAGEKWGKQMWSNDFSKFPDIQAMFEEAWELGIRVGLHNNAGTPEASGGDKLHLTEYEYAWIKSYMDSVITTGYGDWFWPDEFDVLGSNTAPTFSAKGAYEAWKEFTDESRPMFVTRGSYAGHHYATAWSGDINNTSTEMLYQIGFSIDAGLIGYWASSHDLGGFMKKPSNELYTRWVSEFGAWNGIMRTHGHDGREPWLYDTTAQETLKRNLEIRYALYPYIYTMAWQGYSQGVPMMRAMILEDDSQYNPDAWNLNQQYYFGDWFLVAPAADTTDTVVSVWLPPNTTWYNYYTGKRYEGGSSGKTIRVAAALEEIPVFIKAGAIVPMGPNVNYADELPLNPLTLDIYPSGTSTYTLYEDDGISRRYITENAYSTTDFTCIENGNMISFNIAQRVNHNANVFQPSERSYNLKFNHLNVVYGVELNGINLNPVYSVSEYNDAEEAYYLDQDNNILYVKLVDTGEQLDVVISSDGIEQPEAGNEDEGMPPFRIESGARFELENAEFMPVDGGQVIVDTEWKGYSGTGYVKGFKTIGDALQLKVNIVKGGTYNLVLRVNNGKKNIEQYDSTPRTAALYIDGVKYKDLAFAVTNTWGDSEKNGVWVNYTIKDVTLSSGVHTINIVAEGLNPGNFNLDYIRFNRQDTSTNAFSEISVEKAGVLNNFTIDSYGDNPIITTATSGAWAQFNEIKGADKGGVKIKLKSSTGGNLIVYENGIGDKILAQIELPYNNEWTIIEVNGKNTDAEESNIYLEFLALQGESLEVSVEWFGFIRKIDAYSKVNAVKADMRSNINVRGNALVNIYNDSWVMFGDIDFKEGGTQTLILNAASNTVGGIVEIYIDSIDNENKIAEMNITNTGSWSTIKTFYTDCVSVSGIHNVYFKFKTSSNLAICDFTDFSFSKDMISVSSEIIGSNASVQISNILAIEGDTVIFQVIGLKTNYQVSYVEVIDSIGNNLTLTELSKTRYSFLLTDNMPVVINVETAERIISIEKTTTVELEDGIGITNDNFTGLRIEQQWQGYTGNGYVSGWKTVGNYVKFKGEIIEEGYYIITLKGAAGRKNEPIYDDSPRSGALYIDYDRIGAFELDVQDSWEIWSDYNFEPIRLEAGVYEFLIVSEGSVNPGNYNLDSLSFQFIIYKEELLNLIDEGKNLNEKIYTQASWQHYRDVLSESINVYENEAASQNDVDKATNKLRAAHNNLTEKTSKDIVLYLGIICIIVVCFVFIIFFFNKRSKKKFIN